MSVQNYTELLAHKGHDIKIHTYYDENVAIECNDCFEVLLDFDNEIEEVVCACEVCESPDRNNIFAEGFCQECYEECRGENA